MTLLEALNWRYAVQKFSDEKINKTELEELLDTVRMSASSYGLQPYNILVLESKSLREQLLPFSYGQDKILHSSHLVILAVDTNIGDVTVDRYIEKYSEVSGRSVDELTGYAIHLKQALAAKTPEQKQAWGHQQAYIALGNLLTCAAVMKIDTCPMTGIDGMGYDKVLNLHDKHLTTSIVCPIGRRHKKDKQVSRPKVRLDYTEIVMEL